MTPCCRSPSSSRASSRPSDGCWTSIGPRPSRRSGNDPRGSPPHRPPPRTSRNCAGSARSATCAGSRRSSPNWRPTPPGRRWRRACANARPASTSTGSRPCSMPRSSLKTRPDERAARRAARHRAGRRRYARDAGLPDRGAGACGPHRARRDGRPAGDGARRPGDTGPDPARCRDARHGRLRDLPAAQERAGRPRPGDLHDGAVGDRARGGGLRGRRRRLRHEADRPRRAAGPHPHPSRQCPRGPERPRRARQFGLLARRDRSGGRSAVVDAAGGPSPARGPGQRHGNRGAGTARGLRRPSAQRREPARSRPGGSGGRRRPLALPSPMSGPSARANCCSG